MDRRWLFEWTMHDVTTVTPFEMAVLSKVLVTIRISMTQEVRRKLSVRFSIYSLPAFCMKEDTQGSFDVQVPLGTIGYSVDIKGFRWTERRLGWKGPWSSSIRHVWTVIKGGVEADGTEKGKRDGAH